MDLENKELVKRLMYITVDRLTKESTSEEELEYLEEIIDILNQMF